MLETTYLQRETMELAGARMVGARTVAGARLVDAVGVKDRNQVEVSARQQRLHSSVLLQITCKTGRR